MNMLEALAKAKDGTIWARPVSFRGTGSGICWGDERGWLDVPSPKGGHPAYIPCLDDLFGEWETVTANEANIEGEKLKYGRNKDFYEEIERKKA